MQCPLELPRMPASELLDSVTVDSSTDVFRLVSEPARAVPASPPVEPPPEVLALLRNVERVGLRATVRELVFVAAWEQVRKGSMPRIAETCRLTGFDPERVVSEIRHLKVEGLWPVQVNAEGERPGEAAPNFRPSRERIRLMCAVFRRRRNRPLHEANRVTPRKSIGVVEQSKVLAMLLSPVIE